MRNRQSDINDISIDEVIRRIVNLSKEMNDFWCDARGWAPIEAAKLLSRSRLDWQVELAQCLHIWRTPEAIKNPVGSLILAWTNLGSLVEGTLMLFLSVFYKDYLGDVDAFKRKSKLVNPDSLQLEQLRTFFQKKIWRPEESWNDWIEHIQQRRNAIHAFKDRDLGTFDEWQNDVRAYLKFLERINNYFPYPD